MNGVNWVREVNRLNRVNWMDGMNLVGRVSCVNGRNRENGGEWGEFVDSSELGELDK